MPPAAAKVVRDSRIDAAAQLSRPCKRAQVRADVAAAAAPGNPTNMASAAVEITAARALRADTRHVRQFQAGIWQPYGSRGQAPGR